MKGFPAENLEKLYILQPGKIIIGFMYFSGASISPKLSINSSEECFSEEHKNYRPWIKCFSKLRAQFLRLLRMLRFQLQIFFHGDRKRFQFQGVHINCLPLGMGKHIFLMHVYWEIENQGVKYSVLFLEVINL